jgi:L-alanine-DL-glutamate epimerase-like enolase superfamily enzyme
MRHSVPERQRVKITDVQALYLRVPQVQERTDSSQDALIVRVDTDAGLSGWGEVEVCPSVNLGIVQRYLLREL